MTRTSFKSFCASTGVTAVSPVRSNTNGYPFVTILRGNEAENLYFSINASSDVSDGQDIKSIANDLFVTDTINATGEPRQKLSFRGNSAYTNIDDLF
jgi:hypothetical protein